DNVYIALFRADEVGRVRWPGNVKKLRLDLDRGLLVDAKGNHAIDTDGRILQSALTFWTNETQLPTADTDAGEVEGRDGRTVERGGAGQKIPGYMSGTANVTGDPGLTNVSSTSARKLYYEDASATNGLADLDADDAAVAALKTDLGAVDDIDALDILKFIRGYDMMDEDIDGKKDTEAREWILGDPLHSRPLPINYGNRNNEYHNDYPDIRIVFGTNDGFFHMLKNTSGSATIVQEGGENWAFMPKEVMHVPKALMANKVDNHNYGVDGAPAVYVHDDDNNGVIGNDTDDKAWVFFGLRRGGRALYAMDVTNPDTPKFMWKITSSSAGFTDLGYTFSNPRVGKLNYDGNGPKPVLVFGGGYDMNKDTKDVVGANDTIGKGVYIVDAQSGKLVWHGLHADMVDGIPSEVSVIDTDGDGLLDRGYVGDMGGRVWRFDLAGDWTKWFVTKLADLGRHYNPGVLADDRRFFHRADFVQYRDSTKDYDAIIVASGDRADPLGTKVENWVYMIKDTDITSGTIKASLIKHYDSDKTVPQLADVTDNCLQYDNCTVSPDLTYGWRMKLAVAGEKSLATPTTLAKKIYVTTFLPPGSGNDGSCDPDEGSGRLYAMSLDDARAVNDYKVDGNDTLTTEDRYVDLQSGGIPAEVVYVPFNKILKPDLSLENVGVSGRWDTYWYKEEN
ncbi:MAG: hypothetical protein L0Z73_07620, partial [Gammaproteobacteria bacterium]|nr:hypothetical protein [Gammaproteobacteria bacterium]